MLKSQGITC